ncbi:MAG: hypothetical protein ACKV2T_05620 [Kofleriaceae bacterium]
MVRSVVVLVALAACGSERTPVTKMVTTLGYALPPAVVVMAYGPEDLAQPWVEGLRASKRVRIVAEVKHDDVPNADADLCVEALQAANVTPIDEILVIHAKQREIPIDACKANLGVACANRFYAGQTVSVTTSVAAYRASSCKLLRSTSLPIATGSSERSPIEYVSSVGAPEGMTIDDAKESDLREARGFAVERLNRLASNVSWRVFPTDSSIQRVEDRAIIIAGPLELGDYFLKTPSRALLQPGIRAVSVERNQTRLELDESVEQLEPGDELHGVSDMMTVTGFTTITGGTAEANGKTHGIGGVAGIARWSWDRSPKMFELQLSGDFVPGIDSRHVGIGFAAGLRVPWWISPFAIVEVGAGGVFQGDHGARAVAGRAGIGAGIEVRRTRWFAFADVRLRGYAIGEYTDSEENPLTVDYEDSTWRTSTGQLGVGWNF